MDELYSTLILSIINLYLGQAIGEHTRSEQVYASSLAKTPLGKRQRTSRPDGSSSRSSITMIHTFFPILRSKYLIRSNIRTYATRGRVIEPLQDACILPPLLVSASCSPASNHAHEEEQNNGTE